MTYDTFRIANFMGVDREVAANFRIRYLTEAIEELNKRRSIDLNEISRLYLHRRIKEVTKEINYLNKNKVSVSPDSITEESIERAKQVPIESLISFINNKAKAFCHEDKVPSLSKHPKYNYCRCFTCNRNFDSIAILMERDGYSFVDAVKELQ